MFTYLLIGGQASLQQNKMEVHSQWTALCCVLILLGTIHTSNGQCIILTMHAQYTEG